MNTDLVAIGLSLLLIVLWTWLSLRLMHRKLDRVLDILSKFAEKEKSSDCTSNIQTDE